MNSDNADLNSASGKVLGAVFEASNTLGAGFLEKVYQRALLRELSSWYPGHRRVGLIGVSFNEDPGGVDKHAKKGEFVFPLGTLWNKGVSIGQGQAPVKQYNVYLRDLIIAGRAKPSFIVSHRLPLSRAVEAYAHFDKRGMGSGQEWTKVLLKPQADVA